MHAAGAYGDCFFGSACILLTGSETQQHDLRLHTVIELIMNINEYTRADAFALTELRYQNAECREAAAISVIDLARDIARPGTSVSAGTAAPLAQVTGRRVRYMHQ